MKTKKSKRRENNTDRKSERETENRDREREKIISPSPFSTAPLPSTRLPTGPNKVELEVTPNPAVTVVKYSYGPKWKARMTNGRKSQKVENLYITFITC